MALRCSLLTALLLVTAAARPAQAIQVGPDPPFGPLTDADYQHLEEFSKRKGFDLGAEWTRVYRGDKEIDEAALGRVFRFSLVFTTFNKDARAYAQLVVNSFLNIGEVLGVPYYTKVLDRQPPPVQQRIRDFFFYPGAAMPEQEREEAQAEVHKMYPTLIPAGFQFARGDSLFTLRYDRPAFYIAMTQDAGTKDVRLLIVNVSPEPQSFVDSFAPPGPPFLLRCQFGKRGPDGSVSALSDEIGLHLLKDGNPIQPLPLSLLAPGKKCEAVVTRAVLLPRIRHALDVAPSNQGYNCVRFLISVSLDDHEGRFAGGKSAFFDLAPYGGIDTTKDTKGTK
jgi:hypothetical protein